MAAVALCRPPTPHIGAHHEYCPAQMDTAAPVSVENGAMSIVNTVQDVSAWLEQLGFPEYVQAFVINEIDGQVLKTLTSEELRDDLGVTNLRHRRDILDAIRMLIANTQSATVEGLPEHGRILDHLSNVRTYHRYDC